MRKNLLLIAMVIAIVGIMFIGCEKKEAAAAVDPKEKAEAEALYKEVNALRDAFLKDGIPEFLNTEDAVSKGWKTKEDVITNDYKSTGRAEGIYFLADQYMKNNQYGKATMDALGQCKKYYEGFPPNKK